MPFATAFSRLMSTATGSMSEAIAWARGHNVIAAKASRPVPVPISATLRKRMPTLRIDSLHFAAGTPYETKVVNDPHVGKRVMPVEVARAMREALSQVVDAGTAKRVSGSFKLADGTPLAMGGKTGTGDNRIAAIGSGGRIISSKSINRTATFVFYIGDHHFGTLTAFVPGRSAENFKFTSALPTQVLKGMAPILTPYLQPGSDSQCQPPQAPVVASALH